MSSQFSPMEQRDNPWLDSKLVLPFKSLACSIFSAGPKSHYLPGKPGTLWSIPLYISCSNTNKITIRVTFQSTCRFFIVYVRIQNWVTKFFVTDKALDFKHFLYWNYLRSQGKKFSKLLSTSYTVCGLQDSSQPIDQSVQSFGPSLPICPRAG